MKPAPYLQVAALVTSLTLGGSYVLFRGGVLKLPGSTHANPAVPPATAGRAPGTPMLMPGSKSFALGVTVQSGTLALEQSAPPQVSDPEEPLGPRSLQLALDPQAAQAQNLIRIYEPRTMMGTTKSGRIDFTAPPSVAAPSPPPPPAVLAPQASLPPVAQLAGGAPVKPLPSAESPTPFQRMLMLGSKSGAVSFATPAATPIRAAQPNPAAPAQPVQRPAVQRAAQPAQR